ncbi:Bug family tripartite tricarboxylate transporter substrate binding protein [Limnohabitans sp.]|uniref:Bug family tripartite tricarboxylate transporter substrate binding protein n=1 Tax=Limnohabitans sp. TaxID=1907725 RepID=UPI0038B9CB38
MKHWIVIGITALCLAAGSAVAQEWPTRPVKLIVPYPAGGGVDVMARALAQRLQDKWQQPITIDNRPGANTLLGTEAAARATDNHTLLFTTDATFTINPHLYTKLPYDADKDFAPVTQLVAFSQMLVANANLPANNLKELLALAKAQPGSLSYASYGPGSQPQLATEMLKQKAGVFIVHIPYRGIPQAITAVVSGEVPLTWSGIVSARPHIASKRIKALAYGGKTRAPAYPDVPTMTELGFPEVDANVWVGVFAPASFAPALVNRMHRDILSVISEADFRSKEIEGKSYDFAGAGPDEFRRHIRNESASRRTTIKTSGTVIE